MPVPKSQNAERTVCEFLDQRERQVSARLETLRVYIEAIRSELDQIARVKAAIGQKDGT